MRHHRESWSDCATAGSVRFGSLADIQVRTGMSALRQLADIGRGIQTKKTFLLFSASPHSSRQERASTCHISHCDRRVYFWQ